MQKVPLVVVSDGPLDTSKRPSHSLEPAIGRWWCFCCECDLYEIKTEADIAEVEASRDYHNSRVWLTREDAIVELVADAGEPKEEVEARMP